MASKRKPARPKKGRRPRGRPTKRTPETVALIERALRSGVARRSAAAIADVAVSTFSEWLLDPVFRKTCEKAEAEARARLAGVLYRRATEGSDTCLIWWQKCRDPEFRDGRDRLQELGGDPVESMAGMVRLVYETARRVQAGELPIGTLVDVASAMGSASEILERVDLEQRVEALEKR